MTFILRFILRLRALLSNDTFIRTIKTIVAVVAAQGAIYTTVVPNPPTTQTSVALAGGAGLITLAWNFLLTFARKTQNKKLVKLGAAIQAAAAQLVAEQAKVPTP